jgi:Protein of unknown function (DUF3703)
MSSLVESWSAELAAARAARRDHDLVGEWNHLERAHILSQPMAVRHVRTHLSMLAVAGRRRQRREVVGQLFRVLVAAPGSWTGRYPVGNTGGSDVSAFAVMPVPADLQAALDPAPS